MTGVWWRHVLEFREANLKNRTLHDTAMQIMSHARNAMPIHLTPLAWQQKHTVIVWHKSAITNNHLCPGAIFWHGSPNKPDQAKQSPVFECQIHPRSTGVSKCLQSYFYSQYLFLLASVYLISGKFLLSSSFSSSFSLIS